MKKHKWWLLSAAVSGLLLIGPVATETPFNPESVMPRGCQTGQANCGLIPSTAEEMRAIPLSESSGIRARGLPSSVDLSSAMPPVGNQGTQGSCVAWASGYAVKTYHEKKERNWSYDPPWTGGQGNQVFSPAYIYNQINGGRDGGSTIPDALNLMVRQGAAPWKYMPYNVSDYRSQPNGTARNAARSYKAKTYRALNYNDLNAIKSELAGGNPVIFGMAVDDGFYQLKSQVYDRRKGRNYGGHAMTLVGYDDSKRSPRGDKGAFKIMNSWSTSWGDNGFGWISYRQWNLSQPQVMVMYDEVDTGPGGNETTDPVSSSDDMLPPSQFNATKGTYTNKVSLSWSPVNGAVIYALFRADPNSNQFNHIAYSQTTSYDDSNVQQGVSYKYIIVAAESKKRYSDPKASPIAEGYAAAKQTATKPGKVAGVSAELRAVKGTSVRVTWSSLSEATSYQLVRYNPANKKWQVIANTRSTEHYDNRPIPNNKNFYTVRAVNNAGYGPWADPGYVAIGGNSQPPAVPAGLKASKGLYKDRIEIEWNPVAGASTYYLLRYDYDSEKWSSPVRVRGTKYTDRSSQIKDGDWFAYTIYAANSAGNSGYSEAQTGRTNPHASRSGLTAPAPENVRSVIRNGSITIQWDKAPNAAEYYIFRKEAGSDGEFDLDEDYEYAGKSSGTSYTEKIPGEPGTVFMYVVRSKAALGGESANSASVAGFINPDLPVSRSRSMPGQGLENFTGKWKGQLYDGKFRELEFQISGNANSIRVAAKIDGRPQRVQTGAFASGANSVQAGNYLLDYNSELEILTITGNSSAGILADRSVSVEKQ